MNPLPARPAAPREWATVLLLLTLLLLLRALHLGADTPPWLSPFSAGEYVDEGYKTLAARNLVVFGQSHWHPLDDYHGWTDASPLTNWSFRHAFSLLGPDVVAARSVSLVAFALFLLLALVLLRHRLPGPALAVGLGVVAVDSGLFFFSRIALFEIPILLFLYLWLLLLARLRDEALWVPLLSALVLAPILAFAIKVSALAYLAPVVAGLAGRAVVLRGGWRSRPAQILAACAVVGLALLLFLTRDIWSRRLDLNPVAVLTNLLTNPLLRLSPFLFLAGWLAALHLVLAAGDRVLASAYRCGLVALVLLGPLVYAFFPYDPPRYYVPLLPAYGLVVAEWLVAAAGRPLAGRTPLIVAAAAVAGLTLWLFGVARAFNYTVLHQLPVHAGEHPGIGDRWMMVLALPPALVAAAWLWARRDRWASGRAVSAMIGAAAVLLVVHSAARIGGFLAAPRYEAQAVRAALQDRLAPGSSLAGDWAPFFALGTDFRPLYMNRRFNAAARLPELQPDYFVFSATEDSQISLEAIVESGAVRLGPRVLDASYNNRAVVVYPLQYAAASAASEAGP